MSREETSYPPTMNAVQVCRRPDVLPMNPGDLSGDRRCCKRAGKRRSGRTLLWLRRLEAVLRQMAPEPRRSAIEDLSSLVRAALLEYMTTSKQRCTIETRSPAGPQTSPKSKVWLSSCWSGSQEVPRKPTGSRSLRCTKRKIILGQQVQPAAPLCIRALGPGRFQGSICICQIILRTRSTRSRTEVQAFAAVLEHTRRLLSGAQADTAQVFREALETALVGSGITLDDLRPSWAACLSTGSWAGVLETPTSTSLDKVFLWLQRLRQARQNGWEKLRLEWIQVLQEDRPGISLPMSSDQAILKVDSAWERYAARREQIKARLGELESKRKRAEERRRLARHQREMKDLERRHHKLQARVSSAAASLEVLLQAAPRKPLKRAKI